MEEIKKSIDKLSTGGARSYAVHMRSIEAVQDMDIAGGIVLLMDDVTTTGNSLYACKMILEQSGAGEVEIIAVMPCGLEQIQPPSNRRLAEQILKTGGCLISEYPIGTKIEKYRYVERDRLQSGISQTVLIVEAMERSGTMHTADFAWKQNKKLVCYYYKMLEFASGNQYLETSRRAQILKSMDDALNFLDSVYNDPAPELYEQLTLKF